MPVSGKTVQTYMKFCLHRKAKMQFVQESVSVFFKKLK